MDSQIESNQMIFILAAVYHELYTCENGESGRKLDDHAIINATNSIFSPVVH